MADFTYTATRSLKSGHVVDTQYTITIDLQAQDDEQPTPTKTENIALSGNQVTVLHRIDTFIQVLTDLVAVSGGTPDVDDFAEFFASVAGGETFEFDDGTARNVRLVGQVRRNRQGSYFTYSFRMREV